MQLKPKKTLSMVSTRKMLTNNIISSVEKQEVYEDPKIDEIAVQITLINGDVIPICFITAETEKYLNIVATDLKRGTEKVNVISKEGILRIGVLYNDDIFVEKKVKKEKWDKMVI